MANLIRLRKAHRGSRESGVGSRGDYCCLLPLASCLLPLASCLLPLASCLHTAIYH
ncbi:hypothetical protein [Moorena sp. SIO4G3]|uniref:hypothetical protein n=1 Tax=Moorena sp. SIO4G3 TaxID=2607821 RepID=UPI00142B5A07|nr:hypothetical protein [Moorena sp. SIO4G3]NEO75742.1 hypothetical protein [Moorena sp. SIO4G3]